MSNPSNSFKDGVNAGLAGESASDNPHESTIGTGLFNMLADVVTGGLAHLDEQQAQAASEWEAGRQEGINLAKER